MTSAYMSKDVMVLQVIVKLFTVSFWAKRGNLHWVHMQFMFGSGAQYK